MEYKGHSLQRVHVWCGLQMDVRLSNGERIGLARNRTLATLHAMKAIDKDERQIRAAFRKSERKTHQLSDDLP